VSVDRDVVGNVTLKLRLVTLPELMYVEPVPPPFVNEAEVGAAGAMTASTLFALSAPVQLLRTGVTVYCQRPVGRLLSVQLTVDPVPD
jgi:hypothetical protein